MRIAPNFFETMEIPVVRGRGLTERDNLPAPKVAIINEAAVRKFFPTEDPIGKRFGSNPETSGQMEVVGVVKDIMYNALREPPPATMYVPYVQSPIGAMAFVIRTSTDPSTLMGSVREAVRQVDGNVPLMDMSTQTDHIERRFAQERVFAKAYALFGGLAVLVASIGLFGLMSYNVTRRTTEIGIRMALGAQRQSVLQMVLRESLILVAHRRRDRSGRRARLWTLRRVPAVRVDAARRHDQRARGRRHAGGVRVRRLPAGAACVAARSDGRAAARLVRGQGSGSQVSGIRDQGSGIRDQGQGPGIRDQDQDGTRTDNDKNRKSMRSAEPNTSEIHRRPETD